MGFSEAVGACFSNYVTFRGRAPRSEYWFFVLFQILINLAANIVDYAMGTNFIGALADLVLFLPSLAVAVRRLHDIDRSGWWLLIGIIPIVGWIMLLIWMCTKGSFGFNRFGPDPLPTPMSAPA